MKRTPLFLGAAVIAATLIVGWLVWQHLQTYLRADHEVVLAKNAQRRLFEFTITMQDLESGARGYALTAADYHRNVYRNAKSEIDARFDTADRALTEIDFAAYVEPLRILIKQRKALLQESVDFVAANQRDRAAAVFQSDPAAQNAADMRGRIVNLIAAVDNRLQERLTVCRASTLAMTRWVIVGISVLLIFGSEIVWLLWRDNLRQRRIASELAAARDLAMAGTRARDEFLNVLSHELRTPITPALACVQMLERSLPDGTQLHEDILMIRRQIELEARLIDDLLNVEQTLSGKMVLRRQDIMLHSILKQAIESCREQVSESEQKLEIAMQAQSDGVSGDESRLHLVIWHLLCNAVKFTPAGGSIRLQTSNVDSTIILTVADTGIGMTHDQLRSIFQPFRQIDSSRTRRFGGLGVGLAISRHVVELHGGSLTATSAGQGRGATFTLTLPLSLRPAQALVEHHSSGNPAS